MTRLETKEPTGKSSIVAHEFPFSCVNFAEIITLTDDKITHVVFGKLHFRQGQVSADS